MISRRSLISLGPAFLCAPAIIRVAKIMPIRPYPWDLAKFSDLDTGMLSRVNSERYKEQT
jgi:hypothetical protein